MHKKSNWNERIRQTKKTRPAFGSYTATSQWVCDVERRLAAALVLAYNIKRVLKIIGIASFLAAVRAT